MKTYSMWGFSNKDHPHILKEGVEPIPGDCECEKLFLIFKAESWEKASNLFDQSIEQDWIFK